MSLWAWAKRIFTATDLPTHLRHGALGERAAKAHLQKCGLKLLTANFRSDRGEIDLTFRDGDCLVCFSPRERLALNRRGF